jgi:hypothetical protein
MKSFSAKILKLGINPYVDIPEKLLHDLFRQAGRTKGTLPVRGKLNGNKFKQTVVSTKAHGDYISTLQCGEVQELTWETWR